MHWRKDKKTVQKRGGRLIYVTRNNAGSTNINRTKITRKQKWEEKLTSEISHEKTWTWLRENLSEKLNLFW